MANPKVLEDDAPQIVEFYRGWVVRPPRPRNCSPAVVGLRAAGFREGFARGTRDALKRIWPLLDADARKAAEAIVGALPNDEEAE